MKDYSYLQPTDSGGRNFHFGIREHSMGAICRTAWPSHPD